MDFYAYGKQCPDKISIINPSNNCFADSASNILERNQKNNDNINSMYLTSNDFFYHKRVTSTTNNYLAPLSCINRSERSKIDENLLNTRLYQTASSKMFLKSEIGSSEKGTEVDKYEFQNKKALKTIESKIKDEKALDDNKLYFETTTKQKIRISPRRFISNQDSKHSTSKISYQSPEWFNIVSDRKLKEINENLKKEDTLFIISRFKNWITVTPKSKNRKNPLEKIKAEKLDKTSKVMPKWMQVEIKGLVPENDMISKDYISFRNKKKFTHLIDKDNNNNAKSVFNLGDFRHNVMTKEKADLYMSKINTSPKKFNTWTNNALFHHKFKNDVEQSKIDKFNHDKSEANKKIAKKIEKVDRFKI